MMFCVRFCGAQKKNQKGEGGGEQKKADGGKKEGGGGGGDGGISVVLKTDLHCEGCISKIVKTIRACDGKNGSPLFTSVCFSSLLNSVFVIAFFVALRRECSGICSFSFCFSKFSSSSVLSVPEICIYFKYLSFSS